MGWYWIGIINKFYKVEYDLLVKTNKFARLVAGTFQTCTIPCLSVVQTLLTQPPRRTTVHGLLVICKLSVMLAIW